MKKAIAILLVLIITCTLAACNSGGASSEASSKPVSSTVGAETSNEAEPVVNEPKLRFDPPIEVSVIKAADAFFGYTEKDTVSDNVVYDMWQEVAGIKYINKVECATEAVDQKVKAAIMSNDLPDVIQGSAADFDEMIKNDMLEDLTPYIEKYMSPDVFEKFNCFDGALFKPVMRDGKIYGIPATSNVEGSLNTLWIRKDWLEKIGAAVPKTMEEVFLLAERFTKEDPDGNGNNDTYGLPIDKNVRVSLLDTFGIVANSMGYYPFRTQFDADGNITLGLLNPDIKNALKLLQDLYKMGGIDPEWASKDFMQADESVAAGKIGMWMGVFWKPVDPGFDTTYKEGVEWIQAKIPASTLTGEYRPYVKFPVTAYFGVRKGYANPEVITVIANNMLSTDYAGNAYLLKSRELSNMPEYAGFNINNWALMQFQDPLFFDSTPLKKALDDPSFDPKNPQYQVHMQAYEILKKDSEADPIIKREFYDIFINSLGIHEQYPTSSYVFEAYVGPPTETMRSQGSILEKMTDEVIIRIISGLDDVSAYDKFIADYRALGGDDIIKEINDAVAASPGLALK